MSDFLTVVERARTTSTKLGSDDSKRLRTILGKLARNPIAKIGRRRFNRVEAAQDNTLNLLRNNGHDGHIAQATNRWGAIDWEKLFQLIVEYLPQILELILKLV